MKIDIAGNSQQWEKYFSVLRFIINISQTPTRSLLYILFRIKFLKVSLDKEKKSMAEMKVTQNAPAFDQRYPKY
ncbi:MAG: hypothetical protein F6K25_10735 [Okeania sp. SIO2G4]|uniref:hypothetical protein n=1 Tax=unclassified Okeania TaxID=2634635 RepID=UPI0013B7ED52|nr:MULTISPECIES: hypothetical protein [unclassified Okeania]NEP06107.1 hypothetical protein [Okeania sp. SIO4D6]NEP72005.1 hypothetical protein [Okeania sp. SIO2G5]NEP93536.1 hypothetical protein [Okeania sp. SIO2F5]NEQ91159.1 hypothetical protein [Okeania sp. SIO2G4]